MYSKGLPRDYLCCPSQSSSILFDLHLFNSLYPAFPLGSSFSIILCLFKRSKILSKISLTEHSLFLTLWSRWLDFLYSVGMSLSAQHRNPPWNQKLPHAGRELSKRESSNNKQSQASEDQSCREKLTLGEFFFKKNLKHFKILPFCVHGSPGQK